MEATQNLMEFISGLNPESKPLCVTYFDEAHELGSHYWVILRLLSNQSPSTKMWYVFLGTKSSVSYYAPSPKNCMYLIPFIPSSLIRQSVLSLKLRQELEWLVPPFIALGFDQQLIQNKGTQMNVCMREFKEMKHLVKFGRPMYTHMQSLMCVLPYLPSQVVCKLSGRTDVSTGYSI